MYQEHETIIWLQEDEEATKGGCININQRTTQKEDALTSAKGRHKRRRTAKQQQEKDAAARGEDDAIGGGGGS